MTTHRWHPCITSTLLTPAAVEAMIHTQKNGMVCDMFTLVGVPGRFNRQPPAMEEGGWRGGLQDAIQAHIPEAFYDQQVGWLVGGR